MYFSLDFTGISFFTRATLVSAGISCCRRVSACSFITSRCSTETAKRKITQTMPHNSPGILVFCCWKSRQNSNWVTSNRGAKCKWGRLSAVAVAENWRLSTRSADNLARSQIITLSVHVFFLCSTFAVMQRVAWVCRRQLILVLFYMSNCGQLICCLHEYERMNEWMNETETRRSSAISIISI